MLLPRLLLPNIVRTAVVFFQVMNLPPRPSGRTSFRFLVSVFSVWFVWVVYTAPQIRSPGNGTAGAVTIDRHACYDRGSTVWPKLFLNDEAP